MRRTCLPTVYFFQYLTKFRETVFDNDRKPIFFQKNGYCIQVFGWMQYPRLDAVSTSVDAASAKNGYCIHFSHLINLDTASKRFSTKQNLDTASMATVYSVGCSIQWENLWNFQFFTELIKNGYCIQKTWMLYPVKIIQNFGVDAASTSFLCQKPTKNADAVSSPHFFGLQFWILHPFMMDTASTINGFILLKWILYVYIMDTV